MRATPRFAARLFSWIGALLFLLSLAYFLFAYLTWFGDVRVYGDALLPVTWNVMLFTVFALHHSVFARERVRRMVTSHVAPALERSVYVWIASLLFIAVCAFWRPIPGIAWDVGGAGAWALRVVQVAGLWLTLKSAAILNVLELAGLEPVGGERPARADPDGASGPLEFRTAGPYGWVRHPIYVGWFLFVFAATPMTSTRLVFATVSGLYLLIAIPFEERSMRSASPAAYDVYAGKVRWRLVPGIY